mgnify:CR=1 FL=1
MTSGPRRKYYYCQNCRHYIYNQSTRGNHRREGHTLIRMDITVDENKKFQGLPACIDIDLKLLERKI